MSPFSEEQGGCRASNGHVSVESQCRLVLFNDLLGALRALFALLLRLQVDKRFWVILESVVLVLEVLTAMV